MEKTVKIEASGDYQYPLPDDWIEGFSHIVKVEYPVGTQLEPGDYSVYKSPSGLRLHFYCLSPTTGNIRLTYTTKGQ